VHSKIKLPKKYVRQHGLTLIELLVAISILGFVAVMGWRGLDSIIRSRTALNNQLEQTRGMQLAFAQLQSDCAHLADNTLLPGRPTINVAPNKLSLIRSINTENQPTRMQVVSYRVQDNKLTRQESPYTRDLKELNNYWQTNLNDTDTTPRVGLQNDIRTMSLKVWLKGSTAWQDSKDAMLTVSLNNGIPPLGLEVVLEQVGYSQGLTKLFLLGAI
jgi:general secretion pathway protein J